MVYNSDTVRRGPVRSAVEAARPRVTAMKILLAVLVTLLLVVHYRLWVADDGARQMWQLRETVTEQQQENHALRARNRELEAEVRDLREGLDALEERARSDLGMIREGEVFYQVVREHKPEEAPDE